jgi:hypothetical protein
MALSKEKFRQLRWAVRLRLFRQCSFHHISCPRGGKYVPEGAGLRSADDAEKDAGKGARCQGWVCCGGWRRREAFPGLVRRAENHPSGDRNSYRSVACLTGGANERYNY